MLQGFHPAPSTLPRVACAIRVWSRRTVRSAWHQLIWCHAMGMSVVAPTEGSGTTAPVVSVVICFTSLGRLLKRSRAQRPEGSLPAFTGGDVATSIRSITDRPSLSPSSSTGPPVSAPCGAPSCMQEQDRLTTFRMCTRHGVGSASPPVVFMSASGEFLTPEPTTVPVGQACQHLWLGIDHDVYQRFTCVSHTMLRPSSALLDASSCLLPSRVDDRPDGRGYVVPGALDSAW
jgi:hypothetical protein